MKIRIFQKGFNFSQDGQGNRLVYHLQGCNMRCPWCANPEGISAMENGNFSSQDYETDDIVNETVKSSPMFFGGGGITLTGGEPTMQFDAVRELFTKLKDKKIHTALETNGTHPRLPGLFSIIDQLIMDFKHYDNTAHKKFTKITNQTTKANILAAKEAKKPLLLRIPLINSFNAGIDDISGFKEFLTQANFPGLSVELLTYHEFGKDKWQKCGMEYTVKDGYVSAGRLKEFEKALSESGIKLIKT